MPRQSNASLTTMPFRVDGKPSRLRPREGAPKSVKAIFHEVVMSVPADHFRPADGYLVEAYAQVIALGREAYDLLERDGTTLPDGRLSPQVTALEKYHRSSVALAARLRLAPQSRTEAKSTARQKLGPMSVYDMMDLEED
jgi:hypothetical protein